MTALAKLDAVESQMREWIAAEVDPDLDRIEQWADNLAELRAALSPAELGGVVAWCQADDPLSRTAFSWPGTARNPAHTTPLYATPRAAEAVSEEMIERAARAGYEHIMKLHGTADAKTFDEACADQSRSRISELRDMVRVIVTAALTPPSAKGE